MPTPRRLLRPLREVPLAMDEEALVRLFETELAARRYSLDGWHPVDAAESDD